MGNWLEYMGKPLSKIDLKKLSILEDEADFGFEQITPFLSRLQKGNSVLEVGCGPGILLDKIALKYPELNFSGVEPGGEGFRIFIELLESFKKRANVKLLRRGYENLEVGEKFDFIFLVNVFEHLPNWRHFLDFLKFALSPQGTCLILCPNYHFPYEPHFKLPVIINKFVTYRLFSPLIKKFEQKNEYVGLWKSLNFVKLREILDHCSKSELRVKQDLNIVSDLLIRFYKDDEFRARQSFVGISALVMKKTGLLGLLIKFRFFRDKLPYLKLEISIHPKQKHNSKFLFGN